MPEEDRRHWLNVNPWPEDAVTISEEEEATETDEAPEVESSPILETAEVGSGLDAQR